MKTIVLAYSGGLDTSFCVPYLRERHGARIVTVTVDTGGFTKAQLKVLATRARKLGAARHYAIDAKREVWDGYLTTIIQGHCLRGGVYPLCVSAERTTQAEVAVRIARREGAKAIAHGSTGAGNDQVRFDAAFAALAPDLEVLAPIRDLGISREEERRRLAEHGVTLPPKISRYSINAGLCGVTIGGGETHDAWAYPPEEAWTATADPASAPRKGEVLVLSFQRGVPVALNGRRMDGVRLVTALAALGGRHGVGRGIHLGDTILGIKGRIAFEAPATLIAIAAHRELEKLVLTAHQQQWKNQAGEAYGQFLHAGLAFDPVMRDLKALIASSQEAVTGDVRVRLRQGQITVEGVKSRRSILASRAGRYGESNRLWDGRDAAGFCRIYGLQARLARAAR